MTHLSAEEIKTWYEQGHADDRARMIGHLAECATCRRALSTYAAAAEPETSSTLVSITEAVPRGYAAKKPSQPSRGLAWWRPAYGFAAAAAIVVAVVWVTLPGRAVTDETVRGAELVGLSPVGDASAAVFKYASPFQASRYRVTVRDANGVMVWSAESSEMQIAADADARSRLVAGQQYTWMIAALDPAGEIIAESAPVLFRYQP